MTNLQLPDSTRARLIASALLTREHAYAPYSQYQVGAALLTETGKIFTGCNVENSSYGLTICAERGAIAAAVAGGHTKFRAIAIASANRGSPCGACRQVLAEFGLDLIVIMCEPQQQPVISSLRDLLPLAFTASKSHG